VFDGFRKAGLTGDKLVTQFRLAAIRCVADARSVPAATTVAEMRALTSR
jgi:hypothetical protein